MQTVSEKLKGMQNVSQLSPLSPTCCSRNKLSFSSGGLGWKRKGQRLEMMLLREASHRCSFEPDTSLQGLFLHAILWILGYVVFKSTV